MEKFYNKLNSIKGGHFGSFTIIKRPAEKDTGYFNGETFFDKTPLGKDSLLVRYDLKIASAFRTIFNGTQRFALGNDSNGVIIDSKKYPGWGTYMTGSGLEFLLHRYLLRTKTWNKRELYNSSDSFKLYPDTEVNSYNSYHIELLKKDKGSIKNYRLRIFIRKYDLTITRYIEEYEINGEPYYENVLVFDFDEFRHTKIIYTRKNVPPYYHLKNFEPPPRSKQ